MSITFPKTNQLNINNKQKTTCQLRYKQVTNQQNINKKPNELENFNIKK